ncbi:tripartite tricarboxylate transporter TctB family protein [Cereibacter sp. SYSU M97828]|nr:tripartite tricarboxylate transporter TctB family protein [Cereibacter flavus]
MQQSSAPKVALATAITVAGGVVLWMAGSIPQGFGYDAVGPSLFPRIIGIGLLISGALSMLESFRPADDENGRADLRPVLLILGAMLLLAAGVRIAGWIPTAALVFLAGTIAFGDRRIVLNLVIGVVLAGIILIAFNEGLGLNLPLGPLSRIGG